MQPLCTHPCIHITRMYLTHIKKMVTPFELSVLINDNEIDRCWKHAAAISLFSCQPSQTIYFHANTNVFHLPDSLWISIDKALLTIWVPAGQASPETSINACLQLQLSLLETEPHQHNVTVKIKQVESGCTFPETRGVRLSFSGQSSVVMSTVKWKPNSQWSRACCAASLQTSAHACASTHRHTHTHNTHLHAFFYTQTKGSGGWSVSGRFHSIVDFQKRLFTFPLRRIKGTESLWRMDNRHIVCGAADASQMWFAALGLVFP